MKKRNLYLLCGALAVAVIITAAILIYKGNNYSGDDVDKYAGKWEMIEQWQNGRQVGIGFGDTFLVIEEDGTVKYKDSYESYEADMQVEAGRLSFTNEEGYKYTLSIKKGYLLLDAENTKDQKDPGGLFIYKKFKD